MGATWNTTFELELETDARRRVRRAYAFSALGHVFIVLLLMLRPSPDPFVLPPAITVDLVAAPPSVAPPAAKPAPVARSRPAPPPPPQAKILPKRAPDAMAKPKAPPPPAEPIRRRSRPTEMELGDAMAALRSDLGEVTPPLESAEPDVVVDANAASAPGPANSAGTAKLSPELLAWINTTRRHVQSHWKNPSEFLGRGFVTRLEVQLLADGTVVGQPKVTSSSGDPYADDNAVRALKMSSPLPAPPTAGTQIFIFTPEAAPR